MILVDALYINNSGGKVLLDYLIKSLDDSELEVFYLLDDRINKCDYSFVNENIAYVKASLFNRLKFYKANKNKFSKIFCFGNLPPIIKLNIPVYTYFHQKLFLKIPKDVPLKQRIVLRIKTLIFKKLMPNTNFWLVQTNVVKKEFLNSFPNVKYEDILILPFYPQFKSNELEKVEREKNNFVYVSNGSPHKNHIRLIEAFVQFYDEYQMGKLFLTIGVEFTILQSLINELKLEGYPIINEGFLSREKLEKLYKRNEFLIFPSLSESFGLGLIEAMEKGCNVIGSDLDYTYAVCNPSIVFDPTNVDSIAKAFSEAINSGVKPTEQLVFNKIDELIEILKK